MNKNKLTFIIATVLLTLTMLGGASMYFIQYDEVCAEFTRLGYPTYLIYPLAVAKLLGIGVIWTRKVQWLTNLAYAGFFYNLVLALSAHVALQDGDYAPAMCACCF